MTRKNFSIKHDHEQRYLAFLGQLIIQLNICLSVRGGDEQRKLPKWFKTFMFR